MILKQLRLSRHLTQEQLADMAGLNVRTIQRIESGQKASVESLKCLASALDVDIQQLQQEQFMINKNQDNWQALPLFLKVWFVFNFLQTKPTRRSASRVQLIGHVSGFLFCCLGFISEAALAGGLILLASAYLFNILIYQGDKYGIWYDTDLD
ncbi:helix-turn-helix domain-containing protein [Pseudoalteromonas sp. S16_S37]|uniref:helix-turn-helix domain-containing protein n=1 Tax=Pseudoalteromonas sp. S16_S37 TaxID=2720228 RepID=UPI001680F37E|nr:helix-turn-helix transcriptional regulator [Pseudoalteromonas sp. S16_S37]MBD1583011.1 helix-turn-helix transcriptional regulator [Pseudoalteromonas sp. S16_S37]